ncbi:hypothetical protein PMKS-002091 [Pichia membranifaciens]|uniref:Uncharacterized protein n=1 Tax=Pichia membranifaciens TaxID=4926 RepID=A0A1Q2YGH8_9ASCO|nr:hypothetical protein PMKS-002091 [Pichia membranifaciens]
MIDPVVAPTSTEQVAIPSMSDQLVEPLTFQNSNSSTITSEIKSPNPELEKLGRSIISRLESLEIDRDIKHNIDLHKLIDKDDTKSTLSPIDEHILLNAKAMALSRDHSRILRQNTGLKAKKKLIDDTLYEYKYELINDPHSIVEITCLISFIRRLTKYNFMNSTSQIKHFLKSRIIYSEEGQQLLKSNTALAYYMIDFFMRSGTLSNIAIIEDIVRVIDGWDTYSLNIYLKRSLGYCVDSYFRLRLIEKAVIKFSENKLKLNKTTLYMIYMHIDKASQHSFDLQCFKYDLQKFLIERDLLSGPHFTSILFEDLCNSFSIINAERQHLYKNRNLSHMYTLIDDSIKSIKIMPKFKNCSQLNINRNNYSIKSLRKVFLNSRFKNVECFKKLISAHLEIFNWKRAWNMVISNYHCLQNFPTIPPTESMKSKMLKQYPDSKFTNFGKLFAFNQKFFVTLLRGPIGHQLVSHLCSTSNWQLVIRMINEVNCLRISGDGNNEETKVVWNTFYVCLKCLLDVDLSKSLLDPMCHLILMKYLLNMALNTDLGTYKRWDILFRRLQAKIDSIHNTSFSKLGSNLVLPEPDKTDNVYVWMERVRLVRAKRSGYKDFQLLGSVFDTTECYDASDEVSDVTGNEEKQRQLQTQPQPQSQSQSQCQGDATTPLVSNLVSRDLSVITPFESTLFRSLSSLRILDSKKKIEAEYNIFSEFWDSKNIDHNDVLEHFHLGFINKNYKHERIKWEIYSPNLPELNTEPEIPDVNNLDNETNILRLRAIAKINGAVQENLPELLNSSKKYVAMEKVVTKRYNHGFFRSIDPKNSLNNLLPNDWLYMVLNKCHNDWLVHYLTK